MPPNPSFKVSDEILQVEHLRVSILPRIAVSGTGIEAPFPAGTNNRLPADAPVPQTLENQSLADASFFIRKKEVFAVTGESGSGKSTLACALTRLLPADAYRIEGRVLLSGRDLLSITDEERRGCLRSEIRYLFQEPGQSFNPITRIEKQIGFAFDNADGHCDRFHELLTSFGLKDHAPLMRAYPHELSIGTLQRIMLAAALAPRPSLLIADEPTSAIDFLLKHLMMEKLRLLCLEGLAVMFITHDLPLAKRYAHRTSVLCGGLLKEL